MFRCRNYRVDRKLISSWEPLNERLYFGLLNLRHVFRNIRSVHLIHFTCTMHFTTNSATCVEKDYCKRIAWRIIVHRSVREGIVSKFQSVERNVSREYKIPPTNEEGTRVTIIDHVPAIFHWDKRKWTNRRRDKYGAVWCYKIFQRDTIFCSVFVNLYRLEYAIGEVREEKSTVPRSCSRHRYPSYPVEVTAKNASTGGRRPIVCRISRFGLNSAIQSPNRARKSGTEPLRPR